MMNEPVHSKVGLYEKALPDNLTWEERLKISARAGYDYVEISIDESDFRLARLDWSASNHKELLQAIDKTNLPILTMCLSAHRKYPMGSSTPGVRKQGMAILKKAIRFAESVGIRIIQVSGYDAFYEPSNAETQSRYIEGLRQGIEWASQAGVMLALENVDTPFVESMEKALGIVNEINSPWFQLYPDIGNLYAAGYHPPDEIKIAGRHLVGLHVKDARPGCIRGVDFETGEVPFGPIFSTLSDLGFCGPLTVEMWANLSRTTDYFTVVRNAKLFVDRLVTKRGK